MDGQKLMNKLNYLGMDNKIRLLALKDKLATANDLAVMNELEVCNLIVTKYTLVYAEDEEIGLVETEKLDEYKTLVKVISR
jgi:hypothetical protein